jgi:hypothetical protein
MNLTEKSATFRCADLRFGIMLERERASLVSGTDLRNARLASRNQLRWNIIRASLFGADEMRPFVFFPAWQRVATGGVSSPARCGTSGHGTFPEKPAFCLVGR